MKLLKTAPVSHLLLICGIGFLLVGCSTPQYLMPGGYSSTYQKALTGESIRAQYAAPLDQAVYQHANADTAILR